MAQFIGVVAFCLAVWSYQQNEHKKMVLLQLMANLCFLTHYYLLGSFTGAILNSIGLLRSIVFIFKNKKWASSNWWIVFFSLLCVVAGIYTWEGYLSLLPMVAMIFTTVAFGINNPKITRGLSFPSSPLWLVYNFANHSLGGVLTECFNMTSIIIGMLRFDVKKAQTTKSKSE